MPEARTDMWAQRRVTYDSRGASVMAQVAVQASFRPLERALVAGQEVISYRDLDARSNQVARTLRSLGVGPDALVGIWAPRSIAFTVATLATLKAGGAYVPIDVATPAERAAWMLDDAGPVALLTTPDLVDKVRGRWHTILIDDDAFGSESTGPIECMAEPDNLAYVIYTSGSTGRPKGVEISHSSLSNLVSWHQEAFDVKPSDRASQLASPGFDAAVWEVWPYLTAGASLHLVDEAARSEPVALRDWMISEGITIGFVPTALAERMIVLDWPTNTSLRYMLTGADALRRYPRPGLPFVLVNNYGPTENTVVTTSGVVHGGGDREARPTIGRPIQNVQVYIVDSDLKQVATGQRGEICIAGKGVARGYRNAPQLTEEKFVPNPFDSDHSGRLYKTGDLGSTLPNGEVQFHGRIDEQVKIRGYRIEPNEIASALTRHPEIEASLVVAQEQEDNRELVAYVVAKDGSTLSERGCREFLGAQLPDYMIPRYWVRLSELPVNASGKVSRADLPRPDDSNRLHNEEHLEPRTTIEKQMLEIVGPLVGVQKIGIDDNFFMLGGHSLLGTQLIARIREVFGVQITLRNLFESPTVAALAEEVERLLYLRVEAMTDDEAEQSLKALR
ncbi:MAG: non-ribosomal peptide synthetase [Acidobacteriaceae bacterium]|nr:non-ribosomal peptide synthetase [Acidobacteriaceae bacterium]